MSALSALWKPVPLVARQLRRNARRTVLTFLGLVISFFLFTALESVLYTMTSVISSTASDSLLFLRPRDRLAFWRPTLPSSYTAQVAAMPGVPLEQRSAQPADRSVGGHRQREVSSSAGRMCASRNRSTGRPPSTCSRKISSTSSTVTWPYHTASG